MARRMTQPVAKPWINAIHAYTPGKAKSDDGRILIKLSANENPLGCSPDATAAMADARATLARYPDPASTALREALGKAYDLEADRIVCGTGSDELLNLIAAGYAGAGDEIIYVRYGFSVYDIAARKCAATVVVAPDKHYGTDVDALLALVTDKTRVVFVANPNNPTSTFACAADIARLHSAIPGHVLLVLDQAYAEYLEPEQDDAGLELAEKYDNVFVTRTFSKIYGLAAERIGWGYGPKHIIDVLNRIRGPFNLSNTQLETAEAAVRDQDYVAKCRADNARMRHWLAEALAELGVPSDTSLANFVLARFASADEAEACDTFLQSQGVIVRRVASYKLPHCLRITVGDAASCRRVAHAIGQFKGAK